MNNGTNGNGNGSWASWAKYIVNETKRFGTEINKIEDEIKEHGKVVNAIQTDLIKIGMAETQIHELRNSLEKMEKEIQDLQKFKTRIVAVLGTLNVLLGIAVGILTWAK